MPLRRTALRGPDIDGPLAALRAELALPVDFPADVQAEATNAAATDWRPDRIDATDVPLVTLDPPGSRDLDQAFAIEQQQSGFRFWYAIADVAAFVRPGGAIDHEAHVRGQTIYLPDGRILLHPAELSEGAASLLPGQDRRAVLWELALDSDGEPTSTSVRRATVRSRAQLDYPALQKSQSEPYDALRALGTVRQERERARGAVNLRVPEQEVEGSGTSWTLRYRAPLPVEDWNAQLSLLTGMAAAKLMLAAKVGLLRTMPPPDPSTIAMLQRSATALHVDWPAGESYADVVRRLDPAVPAHAALLRLASVLFRGASYVAFDGTVPETATHSAVAAAYAHATAPLRRLADRYVSEVCLAVCAGSDIPTWARDGLPALPDVMAESDQRAHRVDRAVVDIAEALVLSGHVGEVFHGVVVDADEGHGEVQIADPAVRARLRGDDLPLGQQIDVRLVSVDVSTRKTEFVRVG
jgi:exoribonuclease R